VSAEFGTGSVADLDKIVKCRVQRTVILSGFPVPIAALPGDIRFNVGSDATFSWLFTAVLLGSTAIRVQCSLAELTIDVYKP
jgi:hypothetical protein